MNKLSMAIKWLQEELTKPLIWLTAKAVNKPSMTIKRFQEEFGECLISKEGESTAEKYGAESWVGVVFCRANKTKCVYWIERDNGCVSPVAFSADKIWKQEENRFRKKYGAGQNMDTMPTEFVGSLDWHINGSIAPTKHCDEIVLRDVGQTTDVYCIERKGGDPDHIDLERVREQLQNSINFAFANLNSDGNARFLPVLVAKPFKDTGILAGNNFFVTLNKQPYMIMPLEEGERLPDIKKPPDIQNGN